MLPPGRAGVQRAGHHPEGAPGVADPGGGRVGQEHSSQSWAEQDQGGDDGEGQLKADVEDFRWSPEKDEQGGEGEGVQVLHVKPAADQQGLILRLVNLSDSASRVRLALPNRDLARSTRL